MTLLPALAIALLAQAPLEPEAARTLGFAESLLAEGDFYRAIGEYKRFLHSRPEGPEADSARFSIGLAYVRGGQTEAAIEHFEGLVERYRGDPSAAELADQASLQLGYVRYVGGDALGARLHLREWLSRASVGVEHPARLRAGYLLGWATLASGMPERAAELFASIPVEYPGRAPLVAQARAMTELPYRSPVVAGMLSIVPGLGHVYVGQPLVGLAALSWNALFAFGLYDSIRQGSLGVALVLGVFEALWYLGTVFGAISGAQKFNRDARLNALEELRGAFDDRPESWPPAPPRTGD